MKVGNYKIGKEKVILRKLYEDGTVLYETNFSDCSDLRESIDALNRCIGRKCGLASSNPLVLEYFDETWGKDDIIKELESYKPELAKLIRNHTKGSNDLDRFFNEHQSDNTEIDFVDLIEEWQSRAEKFYKTSPNNDIAVMYISNERGTAGDMYGVPTLLDFVDFIYDILKNKRTVDGFVFEDTIQYE